MSWSEMVGFAIVDAATHTTVGTIASVDDSTLNILFELEDGTLIPAPEELITDVDRQAKTITIELPDGLLDINK
jgi:16S rRNA processing protein RimM